MIEWMILPFKRYVDFKGRSRRMEYWSFVLLNVIVYLVLLGLWVLAVIIPAIAVVIRRLHDRDMSGWWYLGLIVVSWIPIVGLIASVAFLVLMLLPGTPGPNRFGPDPKDPTSAEVFA